MVLRMRENGIERGRMFLRKTQRKSKNVFEKDREKEQEYS